MVNIDPNSTMDTQSENTNSTTTNNSLILKPNQYRQHGPETPINDFPGFQGDQGVRPKENWSMNRRNYYSEYTNDNIDIIPGTDSSIIKQMISYEANNNTQNDTNDTQNSTIPPNQNMQQLKKRKVEEIENSYYDKNDENLDSQLIYDSQSQIFSQKTYGGFRDPDFFSPDGSTPLNPPNQSNKSNKQTIIIEPLHMEDGNQNIINTEKKKFFSNDLFIARELDKSIMGTCSITKTNKNIPKLLLIASTPKPSNTV